MENSNGEISNVYVAKEQIDKCNMCGEKKDLRLGWCWNCAEAQSILNTGKDMYENGEGGVEFPVKEVNTRLKMLINKGWRLTKSDLDKDNTK